MIFQQRSHVYEGNFSVPVDNVSPQVSVVMVMQIAMISLMRRTVVNLHTAPWSSAALTAMCAC